MKHSRRDIPVDPSTTREVGREEFKPPVITDQNVDSLLKLESMSKAGLPASMIGGLKRQAGHAVLQGIAQEERKRAFRAISVYFDFLADRASERELLDALTPFEIQLLHGWVAGLDPVPETQGSPAANDVVIEIESRPVGDTEG